MSDLHRDVMHTTRHGELQKRATQTTIICEPKRAPLTTMSVQLREHEAILQKMASLRRFGFHAGVGRLWCSDLRVHQERQPRVGWAPK